MLTPAQVMVRQRWTEALRSGAYKQGKGFLNKEDHFCCLGVLCEVLHVRRRTTENGLVSYGGNVDIPPRAILERAGLGVWGAVGPGLDGHLPSMNDHHGFTFDEIADVIELDTLMQLDGAL